MIKDLEKLIEIARSSEEPAEPLSEAEVFIRDMQIVQHPKRNVTATIIYWYYRKWKEARDGKKPLTINQLFIGWGNKFTKTRNITDWDTRNAYKLDSPFINPSVEEERLIDIDTRDQRERQKRSLAWRKRRKQQKKETKQNTQV